jgi:hypothetical protein
MSDLGNEMDLPFERIKGGAPLLDQHVHFSGAVVVMASTVDVPEVGHKPALVFRFVDPAGSFYPAFVLVMDDDQMAKLRPLLMESIHAAREAAKAAS